MRFKLGLAFILLVGCALPAAAQSSCQIPIAPAAPDGKTSSQAQMKAGIGDANRFMKDSDVYQQCLVDYVKAQKDQAAKDKTTFDVSIEADAMKKIKENQDEKVKVGGDVNAAIGVFKASHPQ
jgi:uncharacterized lipoprotein YmbA